MDQGKLISTLSGAPSGRSQPKPNWTSGFANKQINPSDKMMSCFWALESTELWYVDLVIFSWQFHTNE